MDLQLLSVELQLLSADPTLVIPKISQILIKFNMLKTLSRSGHTRAIQLLVVVLVGIIRTSTTNQTSKCILSNFTTEIITEWSIILRAEYLFQAEAIIDRTAHSTNKIFLLLRILTQSFNRIRYLKTIIITSSNSNIILMVKYLNKFNQILVTFPFINQLVENCSQTLSKRWEPKLIQVLLLILLRLYKQDSQGLLPTQT